MSLGRTCGEAGTLAACPHAVIDTVWPSHAASVPLIGVCTVPCDSVAAHIGASVPVPQTVLFLSFLLYIVRPCSA